ncbi:MAG: M81 family metallopeptidase [Bowdeniella nasicola]|nr:M81 family metallopeptidase [Bowdeniella nasicola]
MNHPRVAIVGIHIESSTFSPQPATADDFEVTRGNALLARYPWLDETWSQPVRWLPVLHARALPGGVLVRETYEQWKAEIVEGLQSLTDEEPLDGLFFDIHGAMSVTGLEDAEGDLVEAVRSVIGPEPLVGASMDLHGNVSEVLFENLDLLTCYRMAPHEDALESRRRAMTQLAGRLLAGRGKPTKVLVHIPILLPGEMTSTRIEPARRLYARIPYLEAQPGILDAAFWIGFAWADQPRCQAAVVVTGDGDPDNLRDVALAWANEIWAARDEFEFVAPVDSMAGCLTWAEDARRPTFISDSGDNPGAGGADDVTVALASLLAWEPTMSGRLQTICASLHDAASAQRAADLGEGGIGEFTVGGVIDPREPGPQTLTARVQALVEDPDGGLSAALRVLRDGKESGLVVVVTSRRKQYSDAESYARLRLDPAGADVVVVKIGYLEPDLFEMAADWKMALTPGGVDQDLVRLGHSRIRRPMVPFDRDVESVRLTAIVRT